MAGGRTTLAHGLLMDFVSRQSSGGGNGAMAYITMNRFRVKKGSEEDFEAVWLSRDSHLHSVPGFKEFHLLKGPERDDHVLYASHTVWESEEAFVAWTRSEAFRMAHAGAGDNKPMYLGHPELEAFEVIQTM
jgi:heme-degrading monooxygenase HmoA